MVQKYEKAILSDGKDLVNKNVVSCLLKDGREVDAVTLVGRSKQRMYKNHKNTGWVCNCVGRIWWHNSSQGAAEEVELQIIWLVSEKHISRTVHSWRCGCYRRGKYFFHILHLWCLLLLVARLLLTPNAFFELLAPYVQQFCMRLDSFIDSCSVNRLLTYLLL